MFEDRLKKLRIDKNLNMKQTAIALGMPYTTYVSYEKNEREPNSEVLIALGNFFNCSIDYLIGRSNSKDIQSSDIFKTQNLSLTTHEKKVITAYRNKPEMQPAVDKLLGVDEEKPNNMVTIVQAARSKNNDEPITTSNINSKELEIFDSTPQSDESL